MRRISTSFEVVMVSVLVVVGLYLLYEGSVNRSANESGSVIAGAAFLTLGAIALVSAVKSILWHRRMLRQTLPHRERSTSA